MGEIALDGDGHCPLEGRTSCKDNNVGDKDDSATTSTAASTTAIHAGRAQCRDGRSDTGLVTIGLQYLLPDAVLPLLVKVGKVRGA